MTMLTIPPTSRTTAPTASRLWPSLSAVHDRGIEQIFRRVLETRDRKAQEAKEAMAPVPASDPTVSVDPYGYD